MKDLSFYNGKRVLITGHTGFKGSWLTRILLRSGAIVTGISLLPETYPSLFDLMQLRSPNFRSYIRDIRDFDEINAIVNDFKPEIVFHLAAQPIVRTSYDKPVYTFETNVMGTVNLLEAVRNVGTVKSFLNVTTDKVYKNKEWIWGYRENEELNGFDPYSNSKSCSELVTDCYKNSFFMDTETRISTARAGNVIGGGDFAKDRIIPDCIRSAAAGEDIFVRNPNSIRPFQHVLEPLFAYLLIAEKQYEDASFAGNYNVGPDESDCVTVGEITTMFCKCWGGGIEWITGTNSGPHEANYLKLDCSKIKTKIGWAPTWNIEKAIEMTVKFTEAYLAGESVGKCMDDQINEFIGGK